MAQEQKQYPVSYKIHPGIGIARVGDSPDSFYLAPVELAGLPIECDQDTGQPIVKDREFQHVSSFKDGGQVKREGVRFCIYVYDYKTPEGRPLEKGETIQGLGSWGKLVDIEWTVYLANKKASWYQWKELSGEHGYAPDHPRRNADITDSEARNKLIVDPGPQTVLNSKPGRKKNGKHFARGQNPDYVQNFPPPLEPNNIDTLGEIFTDGDLRLTVLGGHGKSGSFKTGFGQPRIEHYANNPGWFDDVSDGPVSAKLVYLDEVDNQYRFVQADPAWVLVAYPAYVPQIANLVTIDEVVYDVAVRYFAFDTYLYDKASSSFDRKNVVKPDDLETWRAAKKKWNPDYYPYFYKEIWPILQRPSNFQWVTTLLAQSLYPHDTEDPRGNFYKQELNQPPEGGDDPYRWKRMYIYNALRKPGQENQFAFSEDLQLFNTDDPAVGGNPEHDPYSKLYDAPLMPLLNGDNPLTNTLPSKFFRLTDTQLFLLRQWALGKFINEHKEGIQDETVEQEPPGIRIDRAALSNGLGGSFCPGGEVAWIIRNPNIFTAPYRIHVNRDYIPSMETSSVSTTPGIALFVQNRLSLDNKIEDGLEPGDLTKYSALPWQCDYNECATQPLDVTYDAFNKIDPDNPDDRTTNLTLWWPAHRPLQVQVPVPYGSDDPKTTQFLDFTRGIPQNNQGDLQMVTAWKDLGFVKQVTIEGKKEYVEVERKNPDIPPYIESPPPPKKGRPSQFGDQ